MPVAGCMSSAVRVQGFMSSVTNLGEINVTFALVPGVRRLAGEQ